MKYKVSIIIPTNNRNQLLKETLVSLADQSMGDWECIVIDDWGSEETKELLDEFSKNDSRYKYFLRPASFPKGASSSRNYGFSLSQGKYIQWLDDDDLLSRNKLEYQINQLEKNGDPKIFTACSWDQYWQGKKLELKYLGNKLEEIGPESYFFYSRKEFSFLPIHSFLMSRCLINSAGLWNNNLAINDDGEFLARVLIASKKLIYTPDCYVLYREHNYNKLSKKYNSENLQKLILSYRLIYCHLLSRGIQYNPFFRWKMFTLFHQFWNTNRLDLKIHSGFFREIGIDLKMARYYNLKYSIYKIVYPWYKKKIKTWI